MKIEFRPLQLNESKAVYDMLQSLPQKENGFENDAFGLTEAEFTEWLREKVACSRGVALGWDWVPRTRFILFINDVPVGYGRLAHYLNPALEKHGGHRAYSIAPQFRGRGYANIMAKEIQQYARKIGLDKILVTINDDNVPSYKAAEKNGAVLQKIETGDDGVRRRFYWIHLT